MKMAKAKAKQRLPERLRQHRALESRCVITPSPSTRRRRPAGWHGASRVSDQEPPAPPAAESKSTGCWRRRERGRSEDWILVAERGKKSRDRRTDEESDAECDADDAKRLGGVLGKRNIGDVRLRERKVTGRHAIDDPREETIHSRPRSSGPRQPSGIR